MNVVLRPLLWMQVCYCKRFEHLLAKAMELSWFPIKAIDIRMSEAKRPSPLLFIIIIIINFFLLHSDRYCRSHSQKIVYSGLSRLLSCDLSHKLSLIGCPILPYKAVGVQNVRRMFTSSPPAAEPLSSFRYPLGFYSFPMDGPSLFFSSARHVWSFTWNLPALRSSINKYRRVEESLFHRVQVWPSVQNWLSIDPERVGKGENSIFTLRLEYFWG